MNKKALIPLGLFAVLVVFLAIGLTRDPREIPSPLIGKAAPAFSGASLNAPEQRFSQKDMLGKVWLLNAWSSWCVTCREEHPVLVNLAKTKLLPIVGLNYKDQPVDARRNLARFGDPYDLSVMDPDGRIGIDYGIVAMPESFIIDKNGVVRYKQFGAITEEALQEKILPLIRELQK